MNLSYQKKSLEHDFFFRAKVLSGNLCEKTDECLRARRGFFELKWAYISPRVHLQNHLSKDSIDSQRKIQDTLDLVSADLQKLVGISLSIANQLRLVEDLLLGKDLVT